jgi:hypothetical protein
MQDKAGPTAPTGAMIVGVLELALTAEEEPLVEHIVYTDNGGPVCIDNKGLTWAVGPGGNWEPVGVSLVAPQVEWLMPETVS